MIIEVAIFTGVIVYTIIYYTIISKLNLDSSNMVLPVCTDSKDPVKISIIIASKNEAINLTKLISALKNLNYSKNDYEAIIVDDNSDDDTFQVAKELISNLNNFSVVCAINKKYEGKRGALDYGISLAKHPFILITDADCTPEKEWLLTASEKFNSECDFIFGNAPFIQKRNIVNKVSCYENFRNLLLAISATNLGFTYTASARNFGFKKSAFEKISGYKNTADTMSGDDDLLLREAVKNKLKVCTFTAQDSFVYSESKDTFKDYLSQRARHTQSSFHYLFKQKMFLALWHLFNIAFILSPLLMFLNLFFIIPFAFKLILDLTTALIYQKKLGYRFKITEIIYLQFLYEMFIIIHFFNAKIGKIEWI